MLALKLELKKRLAKAERVAILGVGSDLKGDDIAGMLVARRLEGLSFASASKVILKVFLGATAPENLTGQIKKFRPTHLLIVDSADTGKEAGAVVLIGLEEIANVSFCTHRMPIKIMADYLQAAVNCQVIIIGIQPKALDFGSPASKEIKAAVKGITEIIKEIFSDKLKEYAGKREERTLSED